MKVNYGGFFSTRQVAAARQKKELGGSFNWYGMGWKIPAAYLCEEGVVLDVCRFVPRERLEDYYKKWKPILEKEGELHPGNEEEMERENPFARNYSVSLEINGKQFLMEKRSSVRRYGLDGEEDPMEAEELMKEYGCDKNQSWEFARISFPWPEGKEESFHSLTIGLKALPVYYEGSPRFITRPDCEPETIKVKNPVSGEECWIHIISCKAETLAKELFQDGQEWPGEYQALTCRITDGCGGTLPEEEKPRIQDCVMSDEPRRSLKNGASSIAVIARPSEKHENGEQTVCSSLHFEQREQTEWMVMFPVTEAEEMTVVLTGQETENMV